MKVSVKWLKDYVDVTVPAQELARRLTMSGNEVKAVEVSGENWDKVFVGQVNVIAQHPNADRLRLATVDLGDEKPTVVCGASNFKVGDKIAFARVGAQLKDGHSGQMAVLKAAKIRGVESRGMICSEFELGISDENSGILVLPEDAPLGISLKEYLGDAVIDLDVTPNRPDCLSVIGIARESAALLGSQVRLPRSDYPEMGSPIDDKISIEIQAPDLCPRYSATLVTNIGIKPSPSWMQERLKAAGMRPINNIVDISNFVMLEYGQPLHTFDYDRLKGQKIIVRRAVEGEEIISLDGVPRKLNAKMLVIADTESSVAVAGVMGGANSEVTESTRNILIEAASFKATSIHSTGDSLGLPSEARYRFERGIAPGLTLPALKRATDLITRLGCGEAATGLLDVFPGKIAVQPVKLSLAKLRRLLGAEIEFVEAQKILESLGLECSKGSEAEILWVKAPYWRSDLTIEEDLIEEVARIWGYDRIPNTLLAEALPQINPDPVFGLKKALREALAGLGFSEVMNFSLVGLDLLKKLTPEGALSQPPVHLANPMTSDMEYLRTTFRGNLLSGFAANRRFQDGPIRLFESGKIYLKRDRGQPDERETLCAVAGGGREEKSWHAVPQELDFYDMRGMLESLLGKIHLNPRLEKSADPGLHPSQQAEVWAGEVKLGVLGQFHPKVVTAFEIGEPLFLLELDLEQILRVAGTDAGYRPLARYPSVIRDLALIVAGGVTHAELEKVMREFPLVEVVSLFDLYEGEQVGAGKKSLAYHLTFRSAEHTLTDEEANRVQQEILSRLKQLFDAQIRE
jgi:phenylalanyl-tRNA synthetase beta chain